MHQYVFCQKQMHSVWNKNEKIWKQWHAFLFENETDRDQCHLGKETCFVVCRFFLFFSPSEVTHFWCRKQKKYFAKPTATDVFNSTLTSGTLRNDLALVKTNLGRCLCQLVWVWNQADGHTVSNLLHCFAKCGVSLHDEIGFNECLVLLLEVDVAVQCPVWEDAETASYTRCCYSSSPPCTIAASGVPHQLNLCFCCSQWLWQGFPYFYVKLHSVKCWQRHCFPFSSVVAGL